MAKPPSVLLYRLGDTDALTAPKTVRLTAPAEALTVDGDALLAAVGRSGELVRITSDGKAKPAATVQRRDRQRRPFGGRTLVAVRDERAVAVVRATRSSG